MKDARVAATAAPATAGADEGTLTAPATALRVAGRRRALVAKYARVTMVVPVGWRLARSMSYPRRRGFTVGFVTEDGAGTAWSLETRS
jgi:hypothetical protein